MSALTPTRAVTAVAIWLAVIGVVLAGAGPANAAPGRPAYSGRVPVRNAVPTAAAAAVAPVATQASCATATPGYARCLSVRQSFPAEPAVMTGHTRAHVVAAVTPSGFGPSDLASAYQLDATRGAGQTVAIVDAYDDPNAASDLAAYRAQYGLPACTVASGCFRKVNGSGATSPLPAPSTGWAGEISLDLDMVSAVCPQCKILLVEGTSAGLTDLGVAVDTAVRLGAKFVSNSYGAGEFSGTSYYDSHYDHPGVAITVSAGDSGYGVEYPASSPYVTSVGGTSLSRLGGTARGWGESAWAGSGSGCASYSAAPAVQTGVGTGCARRAVSDVSAVANPGTGVAVYNTYGGSGWNVYGGTSVSAPIIASVYALAGTPGSTDYPNTYPYAHRSSLYDVAAGANGTCTVRVLCTSATGWDGPTGLGTPNGLAAFNPTGTGGGGGTTPVGFGVAAAVSGTAVPGLPTTVTMTPTLPSGDAVAKIAWTAARTDCTFAEPTAAVTTVTCPASALGSTVLTVKVTDTAGLLRSATSTMAFTIATKRTVSLALTVNGQSLPQSVCGNVAYPVQATAVDAITGTPIKGLPVQFTRRAGAAAAVPMGTVATTAAGLAGVTVRTGIATSVGAQVPAYGSFTAVTAAPVAVTPLQCTASVAASADRTTVHYAEPVTITGSVTASGPSGSVPLAGTPLAVQLVVNNVTRTVGYVVSNRAGAFTATVRPTAAGLLRVALPASTGWTASAADLGAVILSAWTPSLSLTAQYGQLQVGAVNVLTGTVTRTDGTAGGPAAGVLSRLYLRSATGATTLLAQLPTNSAGSFKVAVRLSSGASIWAAMTSVPGYTDAVSPAVVVTVSSGIASFQGHAHVLR
jgi:hypothetical protein